MPASQDKNDQSSPTPPQNPPASREPKLQSHLNRLCKRDKTITFFSHSEAVAKKYPLSRGALKDGGDWILADLPSASGYQLWITQQFPATARMNSMLVGENADYDGDGSTNLLEYAFGTNPTSALSKTSPYSERAANRLHFIYSRPVQIADVLYQPELARSPAGPWSTSGIESVSTRDTGNTRTVTVRSATRVTFFPAQFFRLKVTRQ